MQPLLEIKITRFVRSYPIFKTCCQIFDIVVITSVGFIFSLYKRDDLLSQVKLPGSIEILGRIARVFSSLFFDLFASYEYTYVILYLSMFDTMTEASLSPHIPESLGSESEVPVSATPTDTNSEDFLKNLSRSL